MSNTETTVRSAWPTRYWGLICGVLKSRSINDFALTVLPILAKCRLTTLSAILVSLTIRPLSPATRGTARPVRVLILEKAIFNDDALLSLGQSERVQIFGLPRSIFKAMASGILPREILNDLRYVSNDPGVDQKKRDYRAFLNGLWRRLTLFNQFDAVVTGAWTYYAERELGGALEELGIPFIALHKEGLKAPATAIFLADLFREKLGAFTGRNILVYHQIERENQLESGAASEDRITIVGMPRLDRIHSWRREVARGIAAPYSETPTVLFLAFTPKNVLPVGWGVDDGLRWNELSRLAHVAIVRFARENPSVKVIVRPKVWEKDVIGALLDAAGPIPENLTVTWEGDVFGFIKQSWVVCGHNTTAILEAIAAGKPVIVPRYAEAVEERYVPYIVDFEDAVLYADSPDELAAQYERFTQQPQPLPEELSPEQKRVLTKWAGNPDGAAAGRVVEAILKEIDCAHCASQAI